ncbi:MAG: hypothetical protein U1F76_15500 [Candidatus Competibacteraceae bacterium]
MEKRIDLNASDLSQQHFWNTTPADLLGRHLSVFHNKEQMARVEELLARLVREGEFATEEVWHQKRDGSASPP